MARENLERQGLGSTDEIKSYFRTGEIQGLDHPCNVCDIETKVAYCCGSHPETGEQDILEVENTEYLAYPNEDDDCTAC